MTEQLEEMGAVAPAVNPELVKQITGILRAAGHPRPTDWEAKVHPDAHVVCDPLIQRFLINRYWRETIGALDFDTMNVRYCLVQEGPTDDWLRLFNQGVVKCIVDNQLPAAMH